MINHRLKGRETIRQKHRDLFLGHRTLPHSSSKLHTVSAIILIKLIERQDRYSTKGPPGSSNTYQNMSAMISQEL